jgi:phospholipid/cholesterol/gamma-HCH transport system substrate-binding protein
VIEKFPGLKFVIFALICAVAAAWLISVTGNYRFFPSTNTYEAVLDDGTGLFDRDSVLLSGVRVGEVTNIDIERGNAVVEFTVDDHVQPTDTWEVGARWRNVIGQRYLYLYPVGDGQPLESGDRLPVEQSRPVADISRFFNTITPLLRAIDPEQQNTVLTAMNQALDGKEARTQELVSDLASLSSTLSERETQIRGVIDQGENLLSSYAEREQEIRDFFADFADVSTTLRARNDELVGAVTDIADAQEELDRLLTTNDADIRAVIDDLDTITNTIGRNRGDFEEALASASDGLAVYMLISRWGEWFNIRIVAAQVMMDGDVVYCQTEGGATCSNPNSQRSHGGEQTSMGAGGLGPDEFLSKAPAFYGGAETVAGMALGDRPGAGLHYAANRGAVSLASVGEPEVLLDGEAGGEARQ